MKTKTYTIRIEEGPRSFGASVDELPGCVAVAKTRKEVARLIEEAIAFHEEGMEANDRCCHAPR